MALGVEVLFNLFSEAQQVIDTCDPAAVAATAGGSAGSDDGGS